MLEKMDEGEITLLSCTKLAMKPSRGFKHGIFSIRNLMPTPQKVFQEHSSLQIILSIFLAAV